MTREQAIQQQIDEIMDEFDFHEVQRMFVNNGWTYHCEDEPPSVGELRRTARGLLSFAYEKPRDGCYTTRSGRFSVSLVENTQEKWIRLALMFTPEEYGVDAGVEYENVQGDGSPSQDSNEAKK
jgi:hypothetical protein